MKRIARLLLILFILVGIFALWKSGIRDYVSLEQVKADRQKICAMVADHYAQAVAIYLIIYVLTVVAFLPIVAVMSIIGGFLFGTFAGTIYTNIGATVGAALAFLATRYFLGEYLQERFKERLAVFNAAIEDHMVSYLLFVHFIAVVPFPVVNLLAGLTRVPFWTFVWTTCVGIIPGSLVYVYAGHQLLMIQSARDILSWNIIGAFGLLALLALVPMVLKRLRATRIR